MEHIAVESPFPGAACFRLQETESTMVDARRLAAEGAPTGTAVTAEYQSRGRGRFMERAWESERGVNLLVTVVLDLLGLPALPLRVGLAVALAMEDYAAETGRALAPPAIKWPNDILLGGRKAVGILCESAGGRVLAGIGVNCNQRAFQEAGARRVRPTSLCAELGVDIERLRLLELMLRRLHEMPERRDWREAISARLFGIGRDVGFLPAHETVPQRGRLLGIDERGAILLAMPGRDAVGYSSGELTSSGIDDSFPG